MSSKKNDDAMAMEVEEEEEEEEEDAEVVKKKSKSKTSESAESKTAAGLLALSDTIPWVEKYRPKSMKDVVSHEDIVRTMSRAVEQNRLPNLLLYGPPGTGKTSTILAVARMMHGDKAANMVLELNASDDRGIGVVRDRIKQFASVRQLFATGFKLIILDEADSMTSTAQFALRRVIEQYTSTTRFCLIGNSLGGIIPALQSRCTRFRFGPLGRKQMESRLQQVVDAEGVKIDEGGMTAILALSGGDMRKCLNVLQACHLAYSEVTEANVYICTGNPTPGDVREVLGYLLNSPFRDAYRQVVDLQTRRGLSLTDIVKYVHEMVLRLRLPSEVLAFALDKLSDVEYRLTGGTSEKIQLASLVGVFHNVKEMAVKAGWKGVA